MNSIYQRWLQFQQLDPGLKKELRSLTTVEIEDAFYRRLEFGTAGMRGLLGPGTNRMNRYTVRRTTTGLARNLASLGEQIREKGVVIAYDSRRFSREFAEEAAGVLAHHQIRTYLFPELRPTPILSFAVRYLKASAGIMITASHNPAEYNGYKLYGEDGAQLPPHKVEAILREMEAIQDELTLATLPLHEGIETGWIQIIGDEVDQAYTQCVLSLSLQGKTEANSELKIVFTPLHGTGNLPVRRVLGELGFTSLHTVPEQEAPDPGFSTVSSPNPEEHQAFSLALEQARKQDADLVIGTDPDADRLGLYAKNAEGEFTTFNGNQIGALLLHYVLEQRKAKGILPEKGRVLKSIVTSDLGRAIATSYGVETEDTLTGFKYIAERIEAFGQEGPSFLFGYEESYGYLLGGFVRDKDAVQAAMMCCEMAAFYKRQGQTLDRVLEELFSIHGAYEESLLSFTFQGKEGLSRMMAIMDDLRHRPFDEIGGLAVRELKDYSQGIDGLPAANVLKYRCKDGSWIAVRPSGTEPKIKFYFSTVADNRKAAQDKMDRMKNFLHIRMNLSHLR
ncbi:phospho-sugar mutase [Salinithrix halophila]|uniref:Phosphoglucomutase n=1 Tax=Salinithrix halophila TaxID=1485204 RepID=A0ABV8JCW9_9BACL